MPSTSVVRAKIVEEEPEVDRLAPVQIARVPGMIPAGMLKKALPGLLLFLDEELNYAEGERQGFVRKLARWKLAYKAPLQTKPKHFPIFNSSNITVAVIKEAVNTISAQLVQATLTARPRWVLKDLAKEWEPFIDDLEEFLDTASDRDMQIQKEVVPWIIETAKLGTGILERGYAVETTRVFKASPDGLRYYPRQITKRDGPAIQHIPLDKFWIRFGEKDLQKAKWCAKEMWYSEMQLRAMEKDGKLHDVDKLIARSSSEDSDPVTEVMEDIEETVPARRDRYRLFEVWCTYDIDGKGPAELKLYYDKDLGELFGEFFSPFNHGKRPFIKLEYFPVEDRFYAEGLCEMLEQTQVSISAITNRRADNATMANLKMIIKKKIVSGLKPGDPLYTGKVIETNDPFRDIREFSLSDIYPSTVTEEQIAQTRGERLAGVNEATSGSAMPVSRTTASAQLALLQEQAKRIDLTVRGIREGMNEIGQHTLDMYFQFGVNGKAIAWMGERGRVVEAIFRIPRALLELGYGLRINTPTSLQNRQVRRENKIALFNLLTQAHEKLFPFAQAFAPDQMPMLAASMVGSAKKYLTDVLETFEETDTEGVLAGLTVLERILPKPEDLGGLEAFERAASSAETIEAVARLESSLREAEAFRDRGEGIRAISGETGRVAAPEGVPGGREPSLGFLPDTIFEQGGGQQ